MDYLMEFYSILRLNRSERNNEISVKEREK